MNSMIISWALEGWGVVSFEWLRKLLGFVPKWRESLFAVDWVANALNEVKYAIGAFTEDQRFDPTNKGFLIMF